MLHDLRIAWRGLRARPGFALVAVLTLALGIGANTAVFTVVNGVLLAPLPFADPSRVMVLLESKPSFPILSVSYQNYVDWRNRSTVSDAFASRRFGGAHAAVGQALTLDNAARTIVGVLPGGFEIVQPADAYLPMGPWAAIRGLLFHATSPDWLIFLAAPGVLGLAALIAVEHRCGT
jgi:hypothetical protein